MESLTYRADYENMNKEEFDKYADALRSTLLDFIDMKIEDEDCKALINEYLQFYMHEFMTSTAAAKHHHAYVGGLMDHTLEVVNICDRVSAVFPEGLTSPLRIFPKLKRPELPGNPIFKQASILSAY